MAAKHNSAAKSSSPRWSESDDHNAAGGGFRVNQIAPIGSYPQGASPYGCLDVVGNAWDYIGIRVAR
jgi:formylglycine-generating enzyme required for sulfatase activity